ncbi:hypothetical protein M4I21_00450 [Cellulophaga sp. 20_2_10]|uniref:hypothetical protein n=1 Tax=Cellulophaga sp. 20_2_10 TaxID=2942476 RepID=UPI00201AD4B6|nr:hypothetical protein [Cellulophaga sp. 20_2_10]MCL5244258.1 hypothetical protein [Cellulophaga sp. 20_2_10]
MYNEENIPKKLRALISKAKKWGLGDDGYRDEQIENSSIEELKSLVNIFTEEIIVEFNEWLSDENEVQKSTDEYLLFTCFFMAYEYAESVLEEKSPS